MRCEQLAAPAVGAPSSWEAHLSGKLRGRADLTLGAPAGGIHLVSGTNFYLIRPSGSKSNIHSKSELRKRFFWPGWVSSRSWSSPPSLSHAETTPSGTGALHQEADVTEQLTRGNTEIPLLLPTPIFCHLIPQFRDGLCSLSTDCWRTMKSSKGRIRAVNGLGTAPGTVGNASSCQASAWAGRSPGAGQGAQLTAQPGQGSSRRQGHPTALEREKGGEKRKKNQRHQHS